MGQQVSRSSFVTSTYAYATVLAAIGVTSYVLSTSKSFTALIPAVTGSVFFLFGRIGAGGSPAAQHAHPICAGLSILMFFMTFSGLMKLPGLLAGTSRDNPLVVYSKSCACLASLVYFFGTGSIAAMLNAALTPKRRKA